MLLKKENTDSGAKSKLKFKQVDLIVLECGGNHLELNAKTGVLKYRNVISPADGWMQYPEGYFDEKASTVAPKTMKQIARLFDKLFQSRYPESNLVRLPFGATRKSYMRIQSNRNTLYYTDTHVSESGFQVTSEPVAEEYDILVQLLKQYCNSPQI